MKWDALLLPSPLAGWLGCTENWWQTLLLTNRSQHCDILQPWRQVQETIIYSLKNKAVLLHLNFNFLHEIFVDLSFINRHFLTSYSLPCAVFQYLDFPITTKKYWITYQIFNAVTRSYKLLLDVSCNY